MTRRRPNLTIRLAIIVSLLLALVVALLLAVGAAMRWGGCWACGG